MVINCSVLLGEDFNFVSEAHLRIDASRITDIADGFVSEGIDMKRCLAAPGLINTHTHIGDSFAKDACANLSVHEAVGREGRKWGLYKKTPKEEIIDGMRDSAVDMQAMGTTCFADFREGGIEGIKDLREATKGLGINALALGRDLSKSEFESSDGLGLNVHQLDQVPEAKCRKDKIIGVHAGEIEGEVIKALDASPDLIIHFTKGTSEEAHEAARRGVSVVLCPQANAYLRVGFPPARSLYDLGVNVCLGTDNVMLNSPNLWREMNYLYNTSRIIGPNPLSAQEIFSSATINPAKALRLNAGAISPGKNANIAFIDINSRNLRDNRDILTTLVTRTRPDNVSNVMIDGKFVSEAV